MRFTPLTTPLLLLLLPLLASARGPPSCTLTCVHKALASASCGSPSDIGKRLAEHLPCLCKDKKFLDALEDCIVRSGECEYRIFAKLLLGGEEKGANEGGTCRQRRRRSSGWKEGYCSCL
ncbi:hypothetical protein L873DRAFT_1808699 [Choiromyces venosus 120613-1]|uniref:CFEM domain-containing protein n=1 Tax=Choiromyces venosus 120613-1 TaxID=1336337 RepID=A0A3N4JIM2_9PEZI|nr:hypothetical protein L873DRAFT_1808699 [Choiromyces venosus 120613-1]